MPISASYLYGQDNPSTLSEAIELLQSGQVEQAKTVLIEVTDNQPENGRAWFRLGSAYHQLKEYDKAAAAYRRADSLGTFPQFTRYNLACTYALAGKKSDALVALDRAVNAGFGNVDMLKNDSVLVSLRDEPAFTNILKSADKNARPCMYDDQYRQLDFWLGHWKVYNPQGRLVGENRVERHLEGCMIQENWSGSYGSEGKSLNFYDPEIKAWRQQWVSKNGSVINYTGHFEDGAMRYIGKNIGMDATIHLSRMTLTPEDNGDVHQFIEQSDDNGQTWSVWFDGLYKPANSAK